jgi:FAD:protein FMN transferase
MKLTRVSTVLIFLAGGLALASEAAELRAHRQMRYLMGTVVEIKAYPVDASSAEAEKTDEAINAAFAEVKRLDAMLSNWRRESELMRLNRAAAQAGGAVQVNQELFARLQRALAIAEKSDGGFDPTVGPLVRAWGFLPRSYGRAAPDTVQHARERVGWSKIVLNAENRGVRFRAKGMEIDLGGIAKGYAAERAIEILSRNRIQHAIVSLGGSSISVLGRSFAWKNENCAGGSISSSHCEGWNIYIRDPRGRAAPVANVMLSNRQALATSGTYENVSSGSRRRSHIINPHTGQAIGGQVSVTVVANDAETADALTKPFFFVSSLHSPAAQKILQKFPNASVMLIRQERDSLRIETAGAEPARFISLLSPKGLVTHAAKTR